MSLKLYWSPGACSFVPHTMLRASGEPFGQQMVALRKGEQNSAEFLAVNPGGQVPVLIAEGHTITQIPAICLYLAQRSPAQGFLPTEPLALARAMADLCWFNNTVHPTFSHVFMPHKYAPDEATQATVRNHALAKYRELLGEVQARVAAGSPYLNGAQWGPADVYAMTVLRWGTLVGIDPTDYPTLWSFVQKLAEVPAVAQTMEVERVPLSYLK